MPSQKERVHQMLGESYRRARSTKQDSHRRAQVAENPLLPKRHRSQSLGGRPGLSLNLLSDSDYRLSSRLVYQ